MSSSKRSHADSSQEWVSWIQAEGRQHVEGGRSVSNVTSPVSTTGELDVTSQRTCDTSKASLGCCSEAGDVFDVSSPPVEFGRYRLLRQLGHGGMGRVFLAHDMQLDRFVALKTPFQMANPDSDIMRRFRDEARAAAKILHRHICPIYDISEINGRQVIAMGYIEGDPLSERLDKGEKIPALTAARLTLRIAQALDEAHRQGVVHRDLKPSNIMIDVQGEPVITDFGLALRMECDPKSRITRSGMIVGTPVYMAPEQLAGRSDQIGPCSDMYGLGVVLYEMLTGQVPFTGGLLQMVAQLSDRGAPDPRVLLPDLDPQLAAICTRMMAVNPADRFGSMEEVSESIARYLEHRSEAATESIELESESSQQVAPQKFDPRSWRALLASCFIVGSLLLAILFFIQTPHGTLRVEVNDPDLVIRVDGEMIDLSDKRWEGERPTGRHRLGVRIGQTMLPLNETTTISLDDRARRVKLTVDGVELSGDEFLITRGNATAISIRLEPDAVGELGDEQTGISKKGTPDAADDVRDMEKSNSAKTLSIRETAKLGTPTSGRPVYPVALSPWGDVLAVGELDQLRVYSLSTRMVRSTIAHEGTLSAVCFSQNGELLATGTHLGEIKLNEVSSGRVLKRLADRGTAVSSLAMGPDHDTLAVGYADSTIGLWSLDRDERQHLLEARVEGAAMPGIRSLTFSDDGRTLVTGGPRLTRWDLERLEKRWEYRPHTWTTSSVEFSEDQSKIISTGGSGDPNHYVVTNAADGHEDQTYSFNTTLGGAQAATFLDEHSILITGDESGCIRVWTPIQRTLLTERALSGVKAVRRLTRSPLSRRRTDGPHLATANDDGTVTLLRIEVEEAGELHR